MCANSEEEFYHPPNCSVPLCGVGGKWSGSPCVVWVASGLGPLVWCGWQVAWVVVWVASGLGPLVWCGWQVAWVPLCGVGVAWVPLCGVGGKWPGSPCVVWVWPGSPCVVWVASGLGTAVSEVNWMPPCLLLRLSVQEVV